MTALDQKVLESAAHWYALLKDTPDSDVLHKQHLAWLQESTHNQKAWQQVEKLRQLMSSDNELVSSHTFTKAQASRRNAMKMLGLLLMVAGTGAGLSWQQGLWNTLGADLITAKGESLNKVLSDGSVIQLNTNSAVDVLYTEQQRQLHLRQGEILINTHPDLHKRPFIITTPHGRIRALGTRFIVNTNDNNSRVNMLEHTTLISNTDATGDIRLDAGQQLSWNGQTMGNIQPNPKHIDSWTNGLLIISNWPLSDFITELSRYHVGKISLSSAVKDLRLSGTFQLDDTHSILKNLSHTLNIDVRYITKYWARIDKK